VVTVKVSARIARRTGAAADAVGGRRAVIAETMTSGEDMPKFVVDRLFHRDGLRGAG